MAQRTTEAVYRPGDRLLGKYRVERVIGEGGFGVVLAARHEVLDERVAIKILLREAAELPGAAERFLREGKAAVRIKSEHVAKVMDVGSLDDGRPFMVLEFLDGHDLSAIVKTRGPQPWTEVVEWVLQACEAIAEAHSIGIVHRDLKPANLFLTRKVDDSPCVKVLDFGISKIKNDGQDKGMTKTSDVMGSPFYMSPEQMRSTRDADARSDIWALGTILFELLGGVPPFDAETMTGLVVAIMQESPRDLRSMRSDLPPGLVEVVLRCLQKDPNARYQDVASLAVALAPFAGPRSQHHIERIVAYLQRSGGRAPSSYAPSSAQPSSPPHAAAPHGSQSQPVYGDGAAASAPGRASSSDAWSSGPATAVPATLAAPGAPSAAPHGGPAQGGPALLAAAHSNASASWGHTQGAQARKRSPALAGALAGGFALLAIGGAALYFSPSRGSSAKLSLTIDLPDGPAGDTSPRAAAEPHDASLPLASASASAEASVSPAGSAAPAEREPLSAASAAPSVAPSAPAATTPRLPPPLPKPAATGAVGSPSAPKATATAKPGSPPTAAPTSPPAPKDPFDTRD